jgi:predicted transcriptional regulator
MAGLDQEIRSEPTHNGGVKRRRLWQIADALDETDRVALFAALDDFSVPARSIVRALAKRGFVVSESVISNYRSGRYVSP